MKRLITLKVNGEEVTVGVEPDKTLLWLLREGLNLTGTKEGCGAGECGACTVIFNGKAVNSCLVLAVEADGAEVYTIEGEAKDGQLSELQKAFIEHNALQCGFCTPGMIMAARALLNRNPNPTEEEIKEAIEGNLCRCTGYVPIVEAIKAAAAREARK
ncbi:(2Fe-2S)-binding protein [Thermanaeromonas sp. C210]|uniref:(2Fe-2S)-binding protein n=1 Tax=Thermanaeromonas sp. C210 TaxID=2731925 RepID=UPI00155BB70C|nr:(2Fe-2S)-binding protein [Thermanaeromonas sp. C210]GFN24097.1 carbon monoxide dehydrogenase [Thermanaeromonas sp. C210]